jgi:hypothetical protein
LTVKERASAINLSRGVNFSDCEKLRPGNLLKTRKNWIGLVLTQSAVVKRALDLQADRLMISIVDGWDSKKTLTAEAGLYNALEMALATMLMQRPAVDDRYKHEVSSVITALKLNRRLTVYHARTIFALAYAIMLVPTPVEEVVTKPTGGMPSQTASAKTQDCCALRSKEIISRDDKLCAAKVRKPPAVRPVGTGANQLNMESSKVLPGLVSTATEWAIRPATAREVLNECGIAGQSLVAQGPGSCQSGASMPSQSLYQLIVISYPHCDCQQRNRKGPGTTIRIKLPETINLINDTRMDRVPATSKNVPSARERMMTVKWRNRGKGNNRNVHVSIPKTKANGRQHKTPYQQPLTRDTFNDVSTLDNAGDVTGKAADMREIGVVNVKRARRATWNTKRLTSFNGPANIGRRRRGRRTVVNQSQQNYKTRRHLLWIQKILMKTRFRLKILDRLTRNIRQTFTR